MQYIQHTTKRGIKYNNTVGNEVVDKVVDEVVGEVVDEVVDEVTFAVDKVTFAAGDKVVFVVGTEVMASGEVGKGIVALGLTRVGHSMSEGSAGPKHCSSLRSGKFSQSNISGHGY